MSNAVSGRSINIAVTTSGEDRLAKLQESFRIADGSIDAALMSMMARIEQFDRTLARWGNAMPVGKLSKKVADEAADIVKSFNEIERDLQRLNQLQTQSPHGRTLAQEVAARRDLTMTAGFASASLSGRGDIWTRENTPGPIQHAPTPMDIERAQQHINDYNRYMLPMFAPFGGRPEEHDASNSPFYKSSLRQSSTLDIQEQQGIRQRLEQEALVRRLNAQDALNAHNAALDFSGLSDTARLYGLQGSSDTDRAEQAAIRQRMESEAIARTERIEFANRQQHLNEVNRARSYGRHANSVITDREEEGYQSAFSIHERMQAENRARIFAQQQQLATDTAYTNITGRSGGELAALTRSLSTQRTSLLEEGLNGRDVTNELQQVDRALQDISNSVDRINNKELRVIRGNEDLENFRRQMATPDQAFDLDQQNERRNVQSRFASRRHAINEDFRAQRITAAERDRDLDANRDLEQQALDRLDVRHAADRQQREDTKYSNIEGGSVVSLIQQRQRLQQMPQTQEVTDALDEIEDKIRRINQNEINIRVGGDAATRLQQIDQDLTRVTGEYSRLQLQRERGRIERAQDRQRRQERIQNDFASGTIDEQEYNRRTDRLNRRFDRREQARRRDEYNEDWDQGFIDPESGRHRGNQRSVYGNNTQDRRLHYQISNAAFGIDDAIQSYQYDGIRGAVRGASNNITALLSTMNFSPMTMGISVVAASLGSVLIPKLFDTEDTAEKVKQSIERLNTELDRLTLVRNIQVSFERGTAGSPEEGRKTLLEQRKEARDKQAELTNINKQIEALGDLGPAVRPKTYRDAALLNQTAVGWGTHNAAAKAQGAEGMSWEHYLELRANEWEQEDPAWRKSFENKMGMKPEDWFRSQAEEERRKRKREVYGGEEGSPDSSLSKKRAKLENELAALTDSQLALGDRQTSIQQTLSTERHASSQNERYAINDVSTSPLTPEAVQDSMSDLFDEASRTWRQQTNKARKALVDAGSSADTLDIFDTNTQAEYQAFVQNWNDQIRAKVEDAKRSLTLLNEAADRSDVESLSAAGNRRATSKFDFKMGRSTDSNAVEQAARDDITIRRADYGIEQLRLRDEAIANGTNENTANEWYRQRMRKFDLEAQKWINERLDHVEDLLRQENPTINEGLRTWLGKAKNADFLASTGIQDLSDPNLRMHQQEQEYWQQVKQDDEKQKSMRSGLRKAFDPKRGIEEDLKHAVENIDDMQIDLYDKVILKEASTAQAIEQIRNAATVKTTNSFVEGGSQRSLELQQLNLNATNPIVTSLDRQLEELKRLRESIERQRNIPQKTLVKIL